MTVVELTSNRWYQLRTLVRDACLARGELRWRSADTADAAIAMENLWDSHPLLGMCKIATEALVVLSEGELKPMCSTKREHFWCVTVDGRIVDPTSAQFRSRDLVRSIHASGRPTHFKHLPSKRGKELLRTCRELAQERGIYVPGPPEPELHSVDPTVKSRYTGISPATCEEALSRVKRVLGRTPTEREYREEKLWDEPSASTVMKHLGRVFVPAQEWRHLPRSRS